MKARATGVAAAAFLGMIDALYLAAERGGPPIPCRITGGCSTVLTSEYSAVAGIPLPWIGFAFYITVFSLAVFELLGEAKTLKWVFWLAAPAFAVSLGLFGIQAFVLHAYCEYCLFSGLLVTTIFGLTVSLRAGR